MILNDGEWQKMHCDSQFVRPTYVRGGNASSFAAAACMIKLKQKVNVVFRFLHDDALRLISNIEIVKSGCMKLDINIAISRQRSHERRSRHEQCQKVLLDEERFYLSNCLFG